MKILLIFIPLILYMSFYLYQENKFKEMQEEIVRSEQEEIEYKEQYIAKNPSSPTSVLYLFETNKPLEAKSLLNKLVSQELPEAVYAQALLSLEGKYLPNNNEAINTLIEQCASYIEPCVHISAYFRKNKQYKLAIKHLEKALSTNEITVFSELRLIYADKNSSVYSIEKADHYASEMTYAIHHRTRTRYHLTKYN